MALEGISQHPDLWYDDGTVILIAESTGFRVYRGLLSKHSQVFRDMFSLPQPTATIEDTHEGCPVVRLVEDTAEEIAEVLGILHDGYESSASVQDVDYKIPFITVISALRIGTKYEFTALRRAALRQISWKYSEKLDVVQGQTKKTTKVSRWSGWMRQRPVEWGGGQAHIAIFHLSRSFNLAEVLPAALYKCASELTLSELFRSVAAKDEHFYILTTEELQECLATRDYLIDQTREIYQIFLNGATSKSCGCPHRCIAVMKEMVSHYFKNSRGTDADALRPLTSWISSFADPMSPTQPPDRICRACATSKATQVEVRQREIWEHLRAKFRAPTPKSSDSSNTSSDGATN